MILKGFGTWPHFFQHGPKWKSRGQVPNPFGTSLTRLKMKGANIILKRVWNSTQVFFQHGPKWTSRGQVPNPFGTSLAPFKMNRKQYDFKKGLAPDPIFPTWTKVEKQRPGSKPIWDQLGPFRMKMTKIILKGFGTWPHFFQHGPEWKSRGQVPNPFGTSLVFFQNENNKNDFKRVWNMIQLFPTWTNVETQRSGSKSLWDQFYLFQNEKDKHNFERVCTGPISELCAPPGFRHFFIRFLISY